MLSQLGLHSPRHVGLDISSNAVKLLELGQRGGKYTVERYAVAPLPQGAVIDHDIRDVDVVMEAVEKAMARAKSSAKEAVVAMAGSSVITKTIPMDASLKEQDMEAQVRLDAARYIPYSLEEVSLDYEVVPGTEEEASGKVSVLLAACRTESMAARVDAVEAAGLRVKVVDIEPYAMERAVPLITAQLPNGGKDNTVLIVDIGASMTTLTVLHDLNTIYMREEVYGGGQLTEAIQQRYNLSYEDAGRAKKLGGLDESYEVEILTPFKEALVPLVRRSLQFFYSATQYDKVDHIILAGGTAALTGLASMLEERLGVSVSIANPFKHMAVARSVNAKALIADAPALMICCGLAMRGLS